MERQIRAVVRAMLNCENLVLELQGITLPSAKNAEVSKLFLDKANDLNLNDLPIHNEELHEQYWRYCTQSLCTAPPDSEELARAYAERAKFLMHIRKYREGIIDLDQALAIGKKLSKNFTILMLRHKIECSARAALGLETEILSEAQSLVYGMDNSMREKVILSHVFSQIQHFLRNKPSPHLDIAPEECRRKVEPDISAVKIAYSQKYGNHLVATRDIRVGEVVCVEKAYASARSEKFDVYGICSHCLNSSFIALPCDACQIANYCSLSCKKMALEKYHDIECGVLRIINFLYKGEVQENVRLALRMVIMGFKEAGSIKKLMTIVDEADKFPSTLTNEDFRENSFKTFYNLSCHEIFENENYLCYTNVIVTICLVTQSMMFGSDFHYSNVIDLISNPDVVFIAALLFKMSEIASINSKEHYGSSTFAYIQNEDYHFVKHNHLQRGRTIAAYSSFINHSCNPNVQKICSDDHKIIYYSILPISKGSQIFDSYTAPFYSTLSRDDRRTYLQDNFLFLCYCEACVAKWESDVKKEDHNAEHLVLNPKLYTSIKIVDPLVKCIEYFIPELSRTNLEAAERIRKLSAEGIELLSKNFQYPNPPILGLMYILRIAFECTLGPSTLTMNDGACR